MTLKQRSVLVKYDQYLWNLQNGKYYKVNDELRGPQVVQAWGPLERDQGQGLEPSGGGHTGHFLGPPLTLFGLQNPDWHQISHYWGGNPSNILWSKQWFQILLGLMLSKEANLSSTRSCRKTPSPSIYIVRVYSQCIIMYKQIFFKVLYVILSIIKGEGKLGFWGTAISLKSSNWIRTFPD